MVCSNSDNGGKKGSDSGLLSEMQKMKEKQVLEKDQYAFFKCPRIDAVLLTKSTGV